MKRRWLTLALALCAWPALAAGTVTVTEPESPRDPIKRITYRWTSNASGAADGATVLSYTGGVQRLVTVPSASAAPTALYDITITDENGVDVLAGAGANRSATAAEQVSGGSLGITVAGTLTLHVTNAGDTKSGVVYIYVATAATQAAAGAGIGLAVSGGTAGRVLFLDSSGLLADDADLTFSADTLTVTKIGATTHTGNLTMSADIQFPGANVVGWAGTGYIDWVGTLNFRPSSVAKIYFSSSGDINAAATGQDLGSTTNPWRNAVFHMSGTYGTGSWTFAGTPTGNRVATFPGDASFTFAGLGITQTFTVLQRFDAGITLLEGQTVANTGGTNSKLTLSDAAGTTLAYGASNKIVLGSTTATMQVANTSVQANATNVVVAVPDGVVANFGSSNGNTGLMLTTGSAAELILGTNGTVRDFQAPALKTLTESSATAYARIAVPTAAGIGGTAFYTVEATDGTDFGRLAGHVDFAAVNKAGTVTCTIGTDVQSPAAASAANTLTGTTTIVTSTTNCDLKMNAVSSLGSDTLKIGWRVVLNDAGAATVTPQ